MRTFTCENVFNNKPHNEGCQCPDRVRVKSAWAGESFPSANFRSRISPAGSDARKTAQDAPRQPARRQRYVTRCHRVWSFVWRVAKKLSPLHLRPFEPAMKGRMNVACTRG